MTISFAPELNIPPGITDISFYSRAFGAEEVFRFTNDDGSLHVAELRIGEALFHIHEAKPSAGLFAPAQLEGASTAIIGLFVPDVHTVMDSAAAAGAEVISPTQDYDYGYRQGIVRDPFGHRWMIQKKI